MAKALKPELLKRAKALGFDICRVTDAKLDPEISEKLKQAIEAGHHASMEWLATTYDRRKQPRAMWDGAQSAVLLGMNYGPREDPLEKLKQKTAANISVYAGNRDYHDLIKGKLKELAGWLAAQTKSDVKVFVDTAPLMEKPLAQRAGVGWQGKHSNLVSREFGSWLFLGSILSEAELEVDETEDDHCGSCSSCLDICPTDAFPAPYKLDARRCISYLTIEHNGPISLEFRKAMGNRIYGCDDCLAVCPWNKYAQEVSQVKLQTREDLVSPQLGDLAMLDDAAFRKKFSGSPIKRIGRNRFIRNVMIAIGNSKAPKLLPMVKQNLRDPDAMVRGAAVWALGQLEEAGTFADMKHQALASESQADVIEEWNRIGV